MNRYIDADDFFETFEELDKEPYINFPASDVRDNVRGEWIEDKKAEQEHQLIFHKVWTCSQCGERQCRPKGSNFCPNCGADMRGES